jgi:Trk K+ transport system NAD-binding subunit
VVARVSNPANDEVFRNLDIDHVISATGIIFSLIEQHIEMDELLSIGLLAKGQYEVTQIHIGSESSLINKKVQEIHLPSQVHLVWLLRAEESHTITSNTRLEEGDILASIGPKEQIKALRNLLYPL